MYKISELKKKIANDKARGFIPKDKKEDEIITKFFEDGKVSKKDYYNYLYSIFSF